MRLVHLLSIVFVCAAASLLPPAAQARDIPAGPIWNDMDAKGKCPRVCQQNGDARWTGQWHTLTGTATSVCDCEGGASPGLLPIQAQWKEAGPLFSQFDAQNKCPGVCQQGGGGSWDGNWKTTQPGRMSVCSCMGSGALPGPGGGGFLQCARARRLRRMLGAMRTGPARVLPGRNYGRRLDAQRRHELCGQRAMRVRLKHCRSGPTFGSAAQCRFGGDNVGTSPWRSCWSFSGF